MTVSGPKEWEHTFATLVDQADVPRTANVITNDTGLHTTSGIRFAQFLGLLDAAKLLAAA